MAEEQVPHDRLRANAEVFVAAIRDEDGEALAFNQAGVAWLAGCIDSRREDLDADTLAGLTYTLGCFLGECILQTYGGHWTLQEGQWCMQFHEDETVSIGDDEAGVEDLGQWCVQFHEDETVSPFWMVWSHLRYRSVYAVARMFAAIPAMAKVRPGGLYAVPYDDGTFGVYKVLAVDDLAVHLRKYTNHFDQCPTRLDPASLSIGMDMAALRASGVAPSDAELGFGHLPLAHAGFWEMQPRFMQSAPVTEDELDGYRLWLGADAAGGERPASGPGAHAPV